MNEKLISSQEIDERVEKADDCQLRDTDSQQQEFQRQQNRLQGIIDQKINKRRMTSKMIVGNRFEYDMTEFFEFQDKKQQKIIERSPSIIDQLTSDYVSWLVLMYALINGAMIPPWIGTINTCKYFRNSWMFFVKSLLIIPFVMFQKRTCSPQHKQKFTWKYLSKLTNLRKIYWSATSTTIYHIVLWACFDWTYLSHVMILGGLSNFFLSISRSLKKQNHRLQPGGQIVVLIGILLMFIEVYFMDVGNPSEDLLNYRVTDVYFREGYQRLLADLAALAVAFVTAQISKVNIEQKDIFPPFLSIMLVNILVCISTALAGFFFVGAQFSFTPKWGWFSLFTNENFTNFLFECSLFSVGVFLTYALIVKLYPNPTIPGIVMVLDPFVGSFFMQLFGSQHMPGAFTAFGYMLIIPGMILILVGQYLVVEQLKKQPISEIASLQRMKSEHEVKRQTRATIKSKRQNSRTTQKLQAVMARLKQQKNVQIQLPMIKKKSSGKIVQSQLSLLEKKSSERLATYKKQSSLREIIQQEDTQEVIR